MMKVAKYIFLTLLIFIIGYNAVYFRKLSDVQKETVQLFDAGVFSKNLWEQQMQLKLNNAVDLSILIKAINTDKESALTKYTNALGIGNYRYALIKTAVVVSAITDDEIAVQITADGSVINAILATEYIYGNAIRDASSLVAIKDFSNSNDLNSISEELNKIVRTKVLPSFKRTVKKGDLVNVIAAVELNKEHIKWNGLELLPLSLQIAK